MLLYIIVVYLISTIEFDAVIVNYSFLRVLAYFNKTASYSIESRHKFQGHAR